MTATTSARYAAGQVVRGFVMGAADVVPGVSGGTVALVLGIYQRLIDTIRSGARALGRLARADLRGALSRARDVDWAFIVPLVVGILISVVTLASVIRNQLEDNPEEMAGIFFGLVGASTVFAWRLLSERSSQQLTVIAVIALIVFVALGWQAGPVADPSPLAFLAAGMVAICAMILPGISGSFLLLMLGMYGAVIEVVDDRILADAAVFAIGAVIGLALFSTVLDRMLRHHHDTMIAGLIGLMAGSLRVLWPWPDGTDTANLASPTDPLIPVLLVVAGFVVVMVIGRLGRRSHQSPTPVASSQ